MKKKPKKEDKVPRVILELALAGLLEISRCFVEAAKKNPPPKE